MTRYPVFTLVAVSAIGLFVAMGMLLAGFVWLAVLAFAATTGILCLLIASWIGRPTR
ncbi:MAG: hypothetical protein P4L71_10700 [Acetobacteraceae bacterium]|nr:hypothetical protein [Acetobacteraceae bacterium]